MKCRCISGILWPGKLRHREMPVRSLCSELPTTFPLDLSRCCPSWKTELSTYPQWSFSSPSNPQSLPPGSCLTLMNHSIPFFYSVRLHCHLVSFLGALFFPMVFCFLMLETVAHAFIIIKS